MKSDNAMDSKLSKAIESAKQKPFPTVSQVFADGSILEMVYDPLRAQTRFVVWNGDQWTLQHDFRAGEGKRLVPYSPDNNLLKNEVILFPSEPEEYGSQAELVGEIEAFINRYVDVGPLFQKIASYYVLLSWIYDAFNELPYLRLRGDPGCGKTRFLLTVGSLCYKPIFASGASTVSPLFRIIDSFRGTLIIDEGDFRLSDERAEIVKILNNGNAKGFPVLRSEVTPKREFNPTAYTVFGPKLVATRGFFEDRALESRCLTEEMGQYRLRDDIPINLSSDYKKQSLRLRNKLLLFRLSNLHAVTTSDSLVDRAIEPRLNQVFVPLLSIIDDTQARKELRELARQYNREIIADRGMDTEARVLEIIRDLIGAQEPLCVKNITSWLTDRYGQEYDRKITAKWVGGIIRKKLNLRTQKSDGVFVIAREQLPKLERLYEKYGVLAKEQNPSEPAAASLMAADPWTSGTSGTLLPE
jgi:hypothetical protein